MNNQPTKGDPFISEIKVDPLEENAPLENGDHILNEDLDYVKVSFTNFSFRLFYQLFHDRLWILIFFILAKKIQIIYLLQA